MAETKTTTKAPAKKTAAKKAPAKKVVAKQVTPKKTESKPSDDFAVIMTGGKQYIVSVGDTLEVELLGDHKEGDKITFDQVLMTDDGKAATLGDPIIKGGKVSATFMGDKKSKKLSILRFKAKSNFDRKIGHRQKYSVVKIDALK